MSCQCIEVLELNNFHFELPLLRRQFTPAPSLRPAIGAGEAVGEKRGAEIGRFVIRDIGDDAAAELVTLDVGQTV